TNGFHDAANSIATVVSTRVLTPRAAVAWAAFFNFVAAFGFGVAVATTIGKGVVNPEVIDRPLIFAGLAAAFTWDWITWRWGLPTSSSHALIGAFAGAGVTKAGPGVLVWSGLTRILVFIDVSPIARLLVRGQHHPHHHRRDHRRRQRAPALGGALGGGAQRHLGVGADHPVQRGDRVAHLPAVQVGVRMRVGSRRRISASLAVARELGVELPVTAP